MSQSILQTNFINTKQNLRRILERQALGLRFTKQSLTFRMQIFASDDTMVTLERLESKSKLVRFITIAGICGPAYVSCSFGLIISCLILFTSMEKTCAAGLVESIQLALMETKTPPPCLRNM